jgi:hypothetical protein
VAGAEAGDGHVVGGLVGGQHPKGDVFLAAAFELSGGAHAKAVAVQQHAQQQLGVVGGMAVPVITVNAIEDSEVELIDHIEDEPGQVTLGEPVMQVGRQQEGLVAVAAQEVVGHGPFYSIVSLAPNMSVLKVDYWLDQMAQLPCRMQGVDRALASPTSSKREQAITARGVVYEGEHRPTASVYASFTATTRPGPRGCNHRSDQPPARSREPPERLRTARSTRAVRGRPSQDVGAGCRRIDYPESSGAVWSSRDRLAPGMAPQIRLRNSAAGARAFERTPPTSRRRTSLQRDPLVRGRRLPPECDRAPGAPCRIGTSRERPHDLPEP